jgi:hypothetical protein
LKGRRVEGIQYEDISKLAWVWKFDNNTLKLWSIKLVLAKALCNSTVLGDLFCIKKKKIIYLNTSE